MAATPADAQEPTPRESEALGATVGEDADFAALSVRPRGAQTLDLATGVTTLPEGGEVIDRERGVSLTGGFIRYLEGDFIEVRDARVVGAFGTLTAPEVRFEVAPQTLRAAAGVSFEGDGLGLAADQLSLALNDDVAVAEGGVTSLDPALTSERALIDTTGQRALLVGPYSYQNGPVTLRGASGELLALHWGANGAVSAETAVPEAVLERFAAYLP